MLCSFLLYSKVNQLYIYIYPHFFGFPSHWSHHRALSIEFPVLYSRFSVVSCFIHSSVYMSIPISQFIPPSFPPWYPYICSLRLCFCFCFANKFICIIFLDSTYKRYYMIFIFLFLTYFTLYDSFWVHPRLCRWHYFIPFYGWVIFHCIYVPPLLYPFLCRWTLRLLPCPGYCEQHCSEHWVHNVSISDVPASSTKLASWSKWSLSSLSALNF